ncbi:hypothetical protein CPB84DRAFT_1680006, partial [Gymnopilus junonius]
NTHIERLWVEVGTHFARRWRAFFIRLERLHLLDVGNSTHLWLLHNLFLRSINKDCEDFKETWNNHPITHAGSPNVSSKANRFGIYKDDCEDVHPKTIDEFYGADRKEKAPNASDDLTVEDLTSKIHSGQNPQIRHEGVDVTPGSDPFPSPEIEEQFYNVLGNVIQSDVILAGFGLLQNEWEDGEYPSTEVLKISVQARKEVEVELRNPLWYQRAVLWGQALCVLQQFYEANIL